MEKAVPRADGFNPAALMPYELRPNDFEAAIRDLYDLLHDINGSLGARGLRRLEETVRPAIFSGILSDALSAALAQHSRTLTLNKYHNGHPDLIPKGRYALDEVAAGADGVEVKATKSRGSVDMHGAREGWLCVFRYEVDAISEPALERQPTRVTEILLGLLHLDDFRRNERGDLGTRTSSPNRSGLAKLRQNWIYRDL